jgi:hypothetical protein
MDSTLVSYDEGLGFKYLRRAGLSGLAFHGLYQALQNTDIVLKIISYFHAFSNSSVTNLPSFDAVKSESPTGSLKKQHRPCTYNATLRSVRVTTVTVEKQYVLHTECL